MSEEALRLTQLFPTYVVRKQFDYTPEFRAGIRERIDRAHRVDPQGLQRSNGPDVWHSNEHLLSMVGDDPKGGPFDPGPLVQDFCDTFSAIADMYNMVPGGTYEMQMSAWAMVYQSGGYSKVHNHAGSHFSGVYYLDVGKPSKPLAGNLEFVDTRSNWELAVHGMTPKKPLSVTPKTDEMIVFPAWLPHYVHPYVGEGERVAIACNAMITKYTPPNEEDHGSEEA